MTVFLNDRFVGENEAVVSVFDRGFLFGDGVFETVRMSGGCPFLWQAHQARLVRGAEFLKIDFPMSPEALARVAVELSRRNALPEAMVRITLSRGVGVRGYSTAEAHSPTLVMSIHPVPSLAGDEPGRWKLMTSRIRAGMADRLSRHKTANKLPQILARAEAEEQGADDALMLNPAGEVAETASANLFWIADGRVWTPPLCSGALPGVTRGWVIDECERAGVPYAEITTSPPQLQKADGCFATNSGSGIVEVVELDKRTMLRSPITRQLFLAYQAALRANAEAWRLPTSA